MFVTRFGQWIAAVFTKWRAAWAGVGLALTIGNRGADYFQLATNSVLRSQSVLVAGCVGIVMAVFLAWKDERDRIEDIEYRPLLAVLPMVQLTEYAGGFDLGIPLVCSTGEIYDVEAVVYAHFGGRFNALPAPETIQIGHLTSGPQYLLKPSRMSWPSGIAAMREIGGKNFDFHCELMFRYSSVRTGRRYISQESITYNETRQQFDFRRPKPPRESPTSQAVKRQQFVKSIRSWIGAIKHMDG
jgi:hypothetical protein